MLEGLVMPEVLEVFQWVEVKMRTTEHMLPLRSFSSLISIFVGDVYDGPEVPLTTPLVHHRSLSRRQKRCQVYKGHRRL